MIKLITLNYLKNSTFLKSYELEEFKNFDKNILMFLKDKKETLKDIYLEIPKKIEQLENIINLIENE